MDELGEREANEALEARSGHLDLPGGTRRKWGRFVVAALGSIPWVGGVIAASAALHGEKDQEKTDSLQDQWLEEHARKVRVLALAIGEITDRFESFEGQVTERLASEEYLDVIRKAFRAWDEADTEEKRGLLQKLVANAAATSICSDDVVRLFIDWISTYHEIHFKVIRVVYQNPGCTRAFIWQEIYGKPVREDSAEADLFKLMMRDLSTGGVLRQHRETTAQGQFVARRTTSRRSGRGTLKCRRPVSPSGRTVVLRASSRA